MDFAEMREKGLDPSRELFKLVDSAKLNTNQLIAVFGILGAIEVFGSIARYMWALEPKSNEEKRY